jgi:L-asparaginase II
VVLETLTIADAVELAIVERNGFVESRHAGAAVVLSADGDILAQHGDAEALILPRSSLKPLQAIAAVTAGAALEGEQLALGTATAAPTGTSRSSARCSRPAGSTRTISDARSRGRPTPPHAAT